LSSTLLSRKTVLFCCQTVSHIVRLAAAKRYRPVVVALVSWYCYLSPFVNSQLEQVTD
jgi:hypothetical protein